MREVKSTSSFFNVGCTKNIKLVSPNPLAFGNRSFDLKPVQSKAFSK